MATYSYGNSRPYMAKLPAASVRHLPKDKNRKGDPGNKSPHHPSADILTLYGLGNEHAKSGKQKPEDNHKPEWRDTDVQNVVDYYLKAATHGGNPQEPQPALMCECCMGINDYNKRHQSYKTLENPPLLKDDPPKEGSRPHSPEEMTPFTRDKGPKAVRFVGMGDKIPVVPAVPFYRSDHEGPELVANTSYLNKPTREKQTLQQYDDFLMENKKVFVTHPVKRSLYSNWGVNEEVGWYDRDRHMAEGVVEASSKYIDSMQRLKKYGDDRY